MAGLYIAFAFYICVRSLYYGSAGKRILLALLIVHWCIGQSTALGLSGMWENSTRYLAWLPFFK